MSTKSQSEISSNCRTKQDEIITLTEKIKLRKDQYEVLKIICDTYQTSFSNYMQEAIVEAMRYDIEEGNFNDTLLEKIDGADNKNDNNFSSSSSPGPFASGLMNNDLDLLKKLQTQIS